MSVGEQIRYFKWGSYLMRFIFAKDGLYEHKFDPLRCEWKATEDLSRPFYKGDTDLIELTEEEARAFEPRAFGS